MILLDTNIILRFVLNDDNILSPKAKSLISKIGKEKTRIYVSMLAISEVIFTLERSYKLPKLDVAQNLILFLQTPNIVVEQEELLRKTLVYYVNKNISFIDSYHVALMEKKKLKRIYSFDWDFDKFSHIKRLEK